MIKLLIPENEPNLKEIITQLLDRKGYAIVEDPTDKGAVTIAKKDSGGYDMSGLKNLIQELENFLYTEKKGVIYKSLLEIVERPIIESVLERTEGNQLKAARLLGLNRNTIRTKIKKLGINPDAFKQ